MIEYVVLVDIFDKPFAISEKIAAHKNGGLLHRAVSCLVYNDNNEMLIQRRAMNKYHCPGLWANAACTHPQLRESPREAGERRLSEEMGFHCNLKKKFEFIYQVDFKNGLSEYEYDHVFTGIYNGDVNPNPKEACDYKWISLPKLNKDVEEFPSFYAPWFKIILEKIK